VPVINRASNYLIIFSLSYLANADLEIRKFVSALSTECTRSSKYVNLLRAQARTLSMINWILLHSHQQQKALREFLWFLLFVFALTLSVFSREAFTEKIWKIHEIFPLQPFHMDHKFSSKIKCFPFDVERIFSFQLFFLHDLFSVKSCLNVVVK
jgi:hypothetical protein